MERETIAYYQSDNEEYGFNHTKGGEHNSLQVQNPLTKEIVDRETAYRGNDSKFYNSKEQYEEYEKTRREKQQLCDVLVGNVLMDNKYKALVFKFIKDVKNISLSELIEIATDNISYLNNIINKKVFETDYGKIAYLFAILRSMYAKKIS